jgi:hypothetical protein
VDESFGEEAGGAIFPSIIGFIAGHSGGNVKDHIAPNFYVMRNYGITS